MKNIAKIMLVMLSTLSFGLAQAGELTVTGSVKSTYSIQSGLVNAGKGLGVENDFTFGANGENDFGTWAYATDFDGGTALDDSKLTLTTGYGTIGIFISEGGLDTDNSASQSVYARPSDTAYNEGMFDTFDLSASNTFQYHMPADLLPFGIVGKVAFAPSNSSASAVNDANSAGTVNTGSYTNTTAAFNTTASPFGQAAQMGASAFHYQIKANPMTGLNIGGDYLDFNDVRNDKNASLTRAQEPESGSIFATFDYGNGVVGVSKSRTHFAVGAGDQGTVNAVAGTKMSVAYNVNDALSVSYEQEKSESIGQKSQVTVTGVEMKSKGIQAAYTVGGMTLAIAQNKHDNARYTLNNDITDTVFSVAMEF